MANFNIKSLIYTLRYLSIALLLVVSCGDLITLHPEEKYRQMDGFGAAITGSASFNLMQMEAADCVKFLKEVFDPVEGRGFSYVRVPIGCSDFSLSKYTCCDTPGIENFALTTEELDYIIPVLKEIRAFNPDLKIMGSPWTCPRWMKIMHRGKNPTPHNSLIEWCLNTFYCNDYTKYFVKWIKAFEARGIPVYSITPQNEPLNGSNSASLLMEWDEERDFIKTALGPKLQVAGLDVKIYADAEKSFTVNGGTHSFSYTLPAQAAASIKWK